MTEAESLECKRCRSLRQTRDLDARGICSNLSGPGCWTCAMCGGHEREPRSDRAGRVHWLVCVACERRVVED